MRAAKRPATMARRRRIGLLGMFTSRNLGDAAIVREVMSNIALRRPDCEFVAINRDPADAVQLLGIAAFPSEGYGPAYLADGTSWEEVEHPGPWWLDRGLGTRRIVAVLRTLDLLVMSGGGQIEDFFGGPGSQPRVLLTWTALARVFGVPVAYFSVGVDQIFSRASQTMAVNAVRLAQMRSFRDSGSIELLRVAGMRRPGRVDPDPALGMNMPPVREPGTGLGNVIVVSPISFRTWTTVREATYDHYLRALAAACDRWAGAGASLRFVCSDVSMDPSAVTEVLSRVTEATRSRGVFVEVRTAEEFLQQVAAARFVVASRLHGLVLSVAAGVPVIAISPARKVLQFMGDCDLAEFCIDMSAVSEEGLVAIANRVEFERDQLCRKVAGVTEASRAGLASAYDELVALLPGENDDLAA